MTTVTSDPSTWRLQTSGGIKYKFLGTSGSFDAEEGSIQWKALFRSVDLYNVLVELFPAPIQIGNLTIPQAGTMPGLPGLVARQVSFASQDSEMPADNFGADSGAPIGTYQGNVEVTVEFGPGNKNGDSDPRTFLEITSKEGGEFIYAPSGGAKLEDEVNDRGESDESPGGPTDEQTGEPAGVVTADGAKRPVRHPNLPHIIRVPTTEWSVTWKQIPHDLFRNVIVHRLKIMNGRVNSVKVDFMYGALPETLLFDGFDYKESYTWRDGKVDSPPIDVTFKLIEKRVVWRGIVVGHNHVWEPGKGWKRIYVGADGDEEPAYRRWDFNFLFQI